MTRRKHTAINDIIVTHIHLTILDFHPKINLSADYFFVQSIKFLHTISRGCTFRTIKHLREFNKWHNQAEIETGVKNT